MAELKRIAWADLHGYPTGVTWHEPNVSVWQAIHARYGVLCPLVVNQRSGHILNPPGAFEALDPSESSTVGALLVDVALEDEPIVALILSGGIDRALLPRLTDASAVEILLTLAGRDLAALSLVGISLDDFGAILEILSADDAPAAEQPVRSVPGNFDADAWGVPRLDLALQADEAALSALAVKWGTFKRGAALPGCLLHFYTHDSKFSALLKDSSPVVAVQPLAVVEPNFSTSTQMPGALALYRIYQKRTLAAAWQRCGLRLLVDLNVDRRWFDLALLGVPDGWRAYANRATSTDLDHLVEAHTLACERRGGDDLLYVVYGGGGRARQFCAGRGWHWLPEDSEEKRKLT